MRCNRTLIRKLAVFATGAAAVGLLLAAPPSAAWKKKAGQQDPQADGEHLQDRIAAMGGTEPREASKDWIPISDAALWHWFKKPLDLRVEGDAMAFSVRGNLERMCQHFVYKPRLASDAGLRFSLKFAGPIPNLFILFNGEKELISWKYALLVDPEQGRMAFAWYENGNNEGWMIKDSEEIPKGSLKADVFQVYEVNYVSATRRMTVTVDQRKVFDRVLEGTFSLAGSWGIGYGTATTYEVRDVWVKAGTGKPSESQPPRPAAPDKLQGSTPMTTSRIPPGTEPARAETHPMQQS